MKGKGVQGIMLWENYVQYMPHRDKGKECEYSCTGPRADRSTHEAKNEPVSTERVLDRGKS